MNFNQIIFFNKLKQITEEVIAPFKKCSFEFEIQEQYRNMKDILDKCPHVVDYAIEAIKRAGLKPVLSSIRGGTDGSRLSFMGLPCPNIFTGEMAIHSKLEYVSVQDMKKAIDTLIELVQIWEKHEWNQA